MVRLVIPTLVSRALHVLGEVELSGQVIAHERGYRAARARVHSLFDLARGRHREVVFEAGERYGVPVVQADIDFRSGRISQPGIGDEEPTGE